MFGKFLFMCLLFCVLCICSRWAPAGGPLHHSAVDALDSAVRLWEHGTDYVAPRTQPQNASTKPDVSSLSERGRNVAKAKTITTAAKRKRVSPFISRRIAATQGFRCAMCRELLQEDWEIDHIRSLEEFPPEESGANDLSNLQALHKRCHMLKTSMEQRRRRG